MRIILSTLAVFSMFSCNTENTKNEDPYVVKSEIFETSLGSKKVYGVLLQLASPENKKENLGYQISFYQDEKVWVDTLWAELSPDDTLENEVIFSEARVNPNTSVSFKTQSFIIE